MNCIQVCLVLVVSCAILVSANPAPYNFGYSASDLGTVELDAPAVDLMKDCDPLSSSYLVTGSTPAPIMRTAVEIEPARVMSMTPSPIISTAPEFVSMSTPAPILRTAVDIEPARITEAAPLKFESRIAASPQLSAFRPAFSTFDTSPAPIALKTITKTANIGSTIISSGLETLPAVRTQYALAAAVPHVEPKIVVHHSAAPIARPLSTRISALPYMSSSYSYSPQTYASSFLNSYTAPQYYSSSSKFLAAPQYYSSAASIAPQYYSSAASIAPQYYSSAPQYSFVTVAADEPCDK